MAVAQPSAAAEIRPLAQELPSAMGAAKKQTNKQTNQPNSSVIYRGQWSLGGGPDKGQKWEEAFSLCSFKKKKKNS